MIRRTAPVNASRPVRLLAVLAVFAGAALLGGCATTGKAGAEKTSQEWYDDATRFAAKEKYEDALHAYQEAAKGYRGAELDADIQLGLADTYFQKEEYAAAVEAYAAFLRLHPHNPRADYAQLSIGRAWLKQLRSADRSPEEAQKAAAAFEGLLRGYPRSTHLDEGREGLAAARRRLAEHEMTVGDFYQRTGSLRAAVGRYDLVLRTFPDVEGLAERALYEQGRCLERLQDKEQAGQVYERLRKEYPQGRYVQELEKKSKG